MGNIISNTTAQTTALDLSNGNLTVKNQFSASGPSTFNGTGTFNKPVIYNDTSTFNATGVFNKPVTFGDSVSISNNMINGVNLASTATDVSTLRTTVTNLIGPTGTIDTSLVKTSKLDINGDIVNTGTGAAYITASTGAGLVLKDGLTSGGANIKIYNGNITLNAPMSGTSLELSDGLKAKAMTGTSLTVGWGPISSGSVNTADITAARIKLGTAPGSYVDLAATGVLKGGSISVGAMTGTSLNVGPTGTISGGAITGTSMTGTSLNLGATGTIAAGAITVTSMTGTSLNLGATGTITAGAITGTSMTGTSLNVGATGTITAGAMTGTSLNLTGSGSSLTAQQDIISTNGWLYAKGISLTGAGGMTGGFLNVGAGTITAGAISGSTLTTTGQISGTSLNLTGAGTITGSSLNVGTGTLTGGELKIGTRTNWSIKEDTNGRLCFHKGTNNAGFACIDTTGNLVPF